MELPIKIMIENKKCSKKCIFYGNKNFEDYNNGYGKIPYCELFKCNLYNDNRCQRCLRIE